MRNPIIIIIVLILASQFIAACSTSGPDGRDTGIPFVDNALRLELSFGDQDLPEEFLLADPKGLAVKDNGDILVADEHTVKIFDAGGVPKEQLGGQGQGPGEFQEPSDPLIGPAGFFTVGNAFSQFNLYRPDNTFMTRYNGSADPLLRDYCLEEGLTFSYVMRLYTLYEDRRIYYVLGRNRDLPGKFPVFKYLLYSDGNSLEELVKHHSRAYVLNQNGGSSSSAYLGEFHWGMLNKNRIVFAQTHHENAGDRPGYHYILNIRDLTDGSASRIEVGYEPMVFPQSLKEIKTRHFREINLTIKPPSELQAILNEARFLPAFKALRTDGDFVFLFKFNPVNEELEQGIEDAEMNGEEIADKIYSRFEPYSVEIVDVSAGRLVARAKLSCIPDVIKDGRAYRLFTPVDTFPKVECYRVDPAVYQSR